MRKPLARHAFAALAGGAGAAGLACNDVDQGPLRGKLSASGYDCEWRSKFGEDAWGLLEGAAGNLA
jgi:hypothetical protein